MTLDDLPPNFLRVFAALLGLVWGSFLNVVIHRVPRGMSVVRPPSQCPACEKPIRIRDNIPLFGWLFLRGRARCCGAPVPFRYPLVEAIGGVLGLAVLEVIVLPMPGGTSLARAAAIFAVDFTLALALVAAAFIDLEHMILPDSITIGGTLLGLATFSFRSMSLLDALLGAAVGFLVVYLPLGVLYAKIRGREGMGMGDAKLLMLAGAFFGWGGALFVLGAAALQGTAAALLLTVFGGKIEEPEAVRQEREAIRAEIEALPPGEREEALREWEKDPLHEEPGEGLMQARLPFGPFLILATLECLFFGEEVFSLLLGGLGGEL